MIILSLTSKLVSMIVQSRAVFHLLVHLNLLLVQCPLLIPDNSFIILLQSLSGLLADKPNPHAGLMNSWISTTLNLGVIIPNTTHPIHVMPISSQEDLAFGKSVHHKLDPAPNPMELLL
jgi:hypothetical protein